MAGSTAIVDGRVASPRLTRNSARASCSRARARSVWERCSAVSSPTTIPTNSNRPRLSHSPGSPTVKAWTGAMNRKS